eukprot:8157-Amphidinium_carterae.1
MVLQCSRPNRVAHYFFNFWIRSQYLSIRARAARLTSPKIKGIQSGLEQPKGIGPLFEAGGALELCPLHGSVWGKL